MKKKLLVVVVAAALAAVAFATFAPTTPKPVAEAAAEAPEPEKTVTVALAAFELKPGEFLAPRDITWSEVPQSKAPAAALLQDSPRAQALPGALISRSIPAGSAIEPSALVFRDDPEFLSAVLEPGMRAFTIEVDAVTGGAGLLRPGNRVDVILASQTDPKKARGTIRTYDVAQTLLTNMRVIAVDRTIEPVGFSASKEPQDPKAQRAAAAQTSPSRKGTVTLEVTPKDAEVLTVARSAGQLSLTLCDASGEAPRTTGSRRAVTAIRDIVPVKTEAAEVQEVKTYYGASTEPPQM